MYYVSDISDTQVCVMNTEDHKECWLNANQLKQVWDQGIEVQGLLWGSCPNGHQKILGVDCSARVKPCCDVGYLSKVSMIYCMNAEYDSEGYLTGLHFTGDLPKNGSILLGNLSDRVRFGAKDFLSASGNNASHFTLIFDENVKELKVDVKIGFNLSLTDTGVMDFRIANKQVRDTFCKKLYYCVENTVYDEELCLDCASRLYEVISDIGDSFVCKNKAIRNPDMDKKFLKRHMSEIVACMKPPRGEVEDLLLEGLRLKFKDYAEFISDMSSPNTRYSLYYSILYNQYLPFVKYYVIGGRSKKLFKMFSKKVFV